MAINQMANKKYKLGETYKRWIPLLSFGPETWKHNEENISAKSSTHSKVAIRIFLRFRNCQSDDDPP